jgi:hypothetical protein
MARSPDRLSPTREPVVFQTWGASAHAEPQARSRPAPFLEDANADDRVLDFDRDDQKGCTRRPPSLSERGSRHCPEQSRRRRSEARPCRTHPYGRIGPGPRSRSPRHPARPTRSPHTLTGVYAPGACASFRSVEQGTVSDGDVGRQVRVHSTAGSMARTADSGKKFAWSSVVKRDGLRASDPGDPRLRR